MLSSRNLITLEGGLTKDPEIFDEKVAHFSIAVDGAGNERGVKNAPGYFDGKMWLTDSEFTPAANVRNIKTALNEGTLKKGTKVSVIGRLVQERWQDKDGKRSSRTVIMVDSMNILYNKSTASSGASASASDESSAPAIDEF